MTEAAKPEVELEETELVKGETEFFPDEENPVRKTVDMELQPSPEITQMLQAKEVKHSLYPTQGEWTMMFDMAKTLVMSGMLPSGLDTPQKAMTVMLKGRELGIPAMQSISHIYVVDGKPACSSELMLALMIRGGVTVGWLKDGRDGKEASICLRRRGFDDFTSTFSFEDAKKITKYENGEKKKATETYTWKSYLPNMLRSRAISNGARVFAPDLIGGMSYTVEELVDYDSLQAVEAEVRVVSDEMEEEMKKRREEKDQRRREGDYKRLVGAVSQIVQIAGTIQPIVEFFYDGFSIETPEISPGDYELADLWPLDVFNEVEDLEEPLKGLRKLYKEVKEEREEDESRDEVDAEEQSKSA